MKIGYIVAVLAIALLVGCAQTKPVSVETIPELPETIPEPPETIPEPPVKEKEVTEIRIVVRGFDPEEVTVKKGTTVKWLNVVTGAKMLTGDIGASGRIESGSSFEYTFEEAGEYKIFDLFGKRWGKVTVTE